MIFKIILGKEIHLLNSNDKPTFIQLHNSLPSLFKKLPSKYTLSYIDQDGDEIVLNDQYDYDILKGTNLKTVKINLKESNEEFIQLTQKIQPEDFNEMVAEDQEPKAEKVEEKNIVFEQQKIVPEIDEFMITEKLRKLMPEIISKIKSEVSQELEKSRITNKSVISQHEKLQSRKMDEPIITEQPLYSFKKQEQKPKVQKKQSEWICDGCGKDGQNGIRYKCIVCSNFDYCQSCQNSIPHDHAFIKIRNPKQKPIKLFAIINDQENNAFQVNGTRVNIPEGFHNILNQGVELVSGFFSGEGQEAMRNKFNNIREEWKKNGPGFKRGWGHCGRNFGCHQQEKKEQNKRQAQPMMEEVSQDVILRNANYLVEVFAIDFQKGMKWAQSFPHMSRQELLNYVINEPSFFQ